MERNGRAGTRNGNEHEEPVGPAYPARYARLGRVRFDTPARRTILAIGLLLIAGLIILALLSS